MKTYTIIRRPAELHWQDVPALAVDECLWLPPADIAMQAQVCYDDAALYVRLSVREQNIRAEHKTPGCMVCEDSCMEFFFCPAAGDDRYFNFEWNPNGQLYLGFGPNRYDSVRLLVQDEQADERGAGRFREGERAGHGRGGRAQAVAVEQIGAHRGHRGQVADDRHAAGQIVPLSGADAEHWWRSRAEQHHGLGILELRTDSQQPVRGQRSGHMITHAATRFDGVAVIRDPHALRMAVLNGIGRGKAYGCGLLSLAPART